MKNEEKGIVIEINGNMAKVKANRHGDCENCGACPGDNAIVLDVQNPNSAKPGQLVAFEIQEANMLQAAFVVYMMPMIAIFAGVVLGWFAANKFGLPILPYQIVGGVVAFILAALYIRFYDKSTSKNSKMQPMITKILSK